MIHDVGVVLVVDDDEADRNFLCCHLAHSGFSTITADRGDQIRTCVEKHTCDIVLLARHLLDVSGTMILRDLRATYAEAELPIIMIETAGDNTVEALDLGANDCVTKPLDYRVVMARIGVQMARKRAEALRRKSDERYALAVRAVNDGIWDWELATNEISFSPRWKSLLGYEEHELCHSLDEWFDRIVPEDRDQVRGALAAHLGGETPYFECEHRMLYRDHTYRWMYSRGLAIFNASGEPTRIAGSLTDITAWKVADTVTGLPNSIVLLDRIGRAIKRSRRRHARLFALLLLDLDRFSMVNDSLGHAAGDHLLLIVARRLEGCLRAEDLVAHYGKSQSIARMPGDKFAVFIEDIGHVSDVIRIATRIQNVLREPFSLEARDIYLTTSIGMTLSTTGYRCPEDVVRDAEIALHRAKANGRARYEIFDTAMHSQATARLQVETDLHYAIDREELRAFYQPIVSLASGHIYGFEALVRWQHPQRGLIAPGAFIAVAEETGLIIPMGAWILREACRQIQDWQTQLALPSRLQLNVNLCGKEFLESNLVTQVAGILHETGLTASCLTLEITESVLMDNAEAAANTLTRLRALGPKIAIDDFGTGYCSLSYLHTFPLDFLKVDRVFISNMSTGTTNVEIVRAIITLAHAIGLEVIAEGLERAEDIERLQDLGCEYGQGFLFAKPLDADAAEALLCHLPSHFIQHI